MEDIHAYLKALFQKGGMTAAEAQDIATDITTDQANQAYRYLSNKTPAQLTALTRAVNALS